MHKKWNNVFKFFGHLSYYCSAATISIVDEDRDCKFRMKNKKK